MGEPIDNPDAPIPTGETFPGAGWERHSLGRFGERIVTYLGQGNSYGKLQGTDAYVVVESIELGNDPLREQIRVRFHFSSAPSGPDHAPRWGASVPETHVEHRLEPGMALVPGKPRYSFVFTEASSFEENLDDFREFIESAKALMGASQPHREADDRNTSSEATREPRVTLVSKRFIAEVLEMFGHQVDYSQGAQSQVVVGLKAVQEMFREAGWEPPKSLPDLDESRKTG